jgi:hypothetical protein
MDARLSVLLTAGIAAFLVWLAFWGTSPSNNQAGGRAAIEQMLTRTLTENDSAQCTEDMTSSFVAQSFGGHEGTTPMERCLEQNTTEEAAMGESATIKSVQVSGSTARAVAVVHGGSMDGSQLTIDLIAQGGRWKLNHLADIQIDRAKVDQGYLREMQVAGMTHRESRCLIRTFDREFTDAELERATLSGVDNLETEGVGLGCLSRGTLVRMFEKGFASGAQSRGIPAPVADCIASRFTGGMTTAELRAFVKAGEGTPAQSERIRAVAAACAADYRNGVLPRSGAA